jgi:PAS domain S-box-containing protein
MDEKSGNKQESKIQNPKSKILIVEDSEIQAIMLKHILVRNGYTVTWAKNGADGLAAALQQRPALVISDIMMPVMDGYQMSREIKQQEAIKDLPILLLTQLSEPEEVIRGLESGAANYITKPYNANFLLSKVESILENPEIFNNIPEKKSIEFDYRGKHYTVHAGRTQTLGFLLSTYENAVLQNKELNTMQIELKALNERLEEKVKERTVALEESEERFRTTIESAKDAIICLKAPGTIYLWNKKAEEMFGYPAAEAMGRDMHALIVPERYHEKAYEGLDPFFQTGTGAVVGKTIELYALRRDGTEFPIELSISPMQIRGEWQATGIIRDITERKQSEQKLKQQVEELERFKKATIQREIRMKELRDKLGKLS